MQLRHWTGTIVLAVLITSASVFAQTVTFDATYPKNTAVGKMNGIGSFTLAPMQSLLEIRIVAYHPTGGKGFEIVCMTNAGTKTFSGLITGLAVGTDYRVTAIITVSYPGGATGIATSRSYLFKGVN